MITMRQSKTFQLQVDRFSKGVLAIAFIRHEILLKTKTFKTKHQSEKKIQIDMIFMILSIKNCQRREKKIEFSDNFFKLISL